MEHSDEFIILTSKVIDLSKRLALNVDPSNGETANTVVRYELKRFVVQNGIEATCRELLPIIKAGGFEEIAVYIEECLRSNSIETLDEYQLTDEDAGKLSKHFLQLSKASLNVNNVEEDNESEDQMMLCIQDDESSDASESSGLDEETTHGNAEPDTTLVTSITKYTKEIFLASILLAMMGLCTLGGAIFIILISFSFNKPQDYFGNNVPPLINKTIDSASMPSTTMTPQIEQCVATRATMDAQKEFSFEFEEGQVVDWTEEVIDFCRSAETPLHVLESSLDKFYKNSSSFPRIICPENVVSLQLSFDAIAIQNTAENRTSTIMKLLQVFCNLNAIQFSGSRGGRTSCGKQSEKSPTFKEFQLISLRYIKWQNFSGCEDVFSAIMSAIIAPALTRLDFTCVFLSRKNQQQVENLIRKSNNFNTIRCADASLCSGLNLNFNSSTAPIKFDTRRMDCY